MRRGRATSAVLIGWACALFTAPAAAQEGITRDPLAVRGFKRARTTEVIAEPNWGQALASLYVLARTSDGVGLLQPDATLHTGEQIELHVRVGQPAYVYLLSVNPKAVVETLYPAAGEPEPLAPRGDRRIPANEGESLELDHVVGTEQLVFIASKHALGRNDQRLRALIELGIHKAPLPTEQMERVPGDRPAALGRSGAARRRTLADPPVPDDPHPGPTRASELPRGFIRGRTLDTGASGRALDLEPDAGGVAVAVLKYNHAP